MRPLQSRDRTLGSNDRNLLDSRKGQTASKIRSCWPSYLDDPRYVSEKDRGPTPPNVYDLSLRDELFHGVRAIRLNPVGGGNMIGRDGMLAHTYMLRPNCQSNG